MIEALVRILDGTTENEPFDKSKDYLTNAKKKKYSPEQAMRLMLKEPTVFLAPVVFIIFTADARVNITLEDYASIIMKQAKKRNNQKLFEAAKAAYEIGRKADI
jgi:hypothetical protein